MFLDSKQNNQFDKEVINKMIILCHPDKHGGKEIANEVTILLNKIKGEL